MSQVKHNINPLELDGYSIVRNVVSADQVSSVLNNLQQLDVDAVGSRRLLELPWCQALARQLKEHPSISSALNSTDVALQCTYFSKGKDRNWLVATHQDLSIPVKNVVEDSALVGWSKKDGQTFVQAPDQLLEQILAVRLHLDECTSDDGPLRLVRGSHRFGRLSLTESRQVRATHEEVECLLSMGDVLLMRPLTLHASSKAAVPKQRRVLHFLFGPRSPGYNLQWQYAV